MHLAFEALSVQSMSSTTAVKPPVSLLCQELYNQSHCSALTLQFGFDTEKGVMAGTTDQSWKSLMITVPDIVCTVENNVVIVALAFKRGAPSQSVVRSPGAAVVLTIVLYTVVVRMAVDHRYGMILLL